MSQTLERDEEWKIRGSREANLIVVFSSRGDVAEVRIGRRTYDEAKLNAHLIASAPSLQQKLLHRALILEQIADILIEQAGRRGDGPVQDKLTHSERKIWDVLVKFDLHVPPPIK